VVCVEQFGHYANLFPGTGCPHAAESIESLTFSSFAPQFRWIADDSF